MITILFMNIIFAIGDFIQIIFNIAIIYNVLFTVNIPLPNIADIVISIENVIPVVGVYLAQVLAFFDTIITYLNLVLAISSSWSMIFVLIFKIHL